MLRSTWRSGVVRGVPTALIAGTLALNAVAVEAANNQMLDGSLSPSSAIEMFIGSMNEVDPQTTRVSAADLSASVDFKRALIEEEGVRYQVYLDSAGYPTVGIGHLVTAQDGLAVGNRISHDQAMGFLSRDLQTAEAGVQKLLGDLKVYQHEFDALVDLVYNVGIGGVSKSRSPKLNAAINAGDYDAIASQLDYTSAGGETAGGLEHRSDRRMAIFTGGNYENPRAA